MASTSDKLGAQAMEVSNDLKEMGGIVRDAAREKLGQARENVTEFYEQGRDGVRGVVCAFEQYVRERPVKAVLIAAGVGVIAAGGGLLLGRLWRR